MQYWIRAQAQAAQTQMFPRPMRAVVFGEGARPEVDPAITERLEQQPSEIGIVERASSGFYPSRYELLWDLVLNLYWSNRYAIQLYEKRPTRWCDIPRDADDVFMPVYNPWNGKELADIITYYYGCLTPGWDEETENVLFEHLITLFRHKPCCGSELSAIKPSVTEARSNPGNLVLTLEKPGRQWSFSIDELEYINHPVPQLQMLMHHGMVLANQYPWDVASASLCPVDRVEESDWVVLFYPRSDEALNWIQSNG